MDSSSSLGGRNETRQTLSLVLQQNRRKYYDGLIAVVLFFVWQLLICGLQQMTASIDDFPAPILAMLLVAASMILASKFVANMDDVYRKYLRGPTDLINRHMSIGFTVPFTMIMDGPMSSSRNIGRIIAGYIITGVLNTVLVFVFSLGVQTALMSINKKDNFSNDIPSIPSADLSAPVIPSVRIESCSSLGSPPSRQTQDRVRSYVSESTTLTNNPSIYTTSDAEADIERGPPILTSQQQEQPQPLPQPQPQNQHQQPDVPETTHEQIQHKPFANLQKLGQRMACFAAANPILCFSLVGIPVVGLPVALRAGNDTALDTFLLFFLWTGTLAAQAAVKQAASFRRRHRVRTVLTTCLNAVLWSSLGTIAYTAAKAAARRCTVGEALSTFSTGTTLADLIYPVSQSRAPSPHAATMGAGDIASSILDAGIVSWGLKLFECRAQLLSRAGLTTLAAGAVFAAANIACGPLLVHAMGLAPAGKALAFAARSVTLALAGPAMTNLGGDVGLNAAMVVFNGIVFQVAMGLGACRWAARLVASSAGGRRRIGSGRWRFSSGGAGAGGDTASDAGTGTESSMHGNDNVVGRRPSNSDVETLADGTSSAPQSSSESDSSKDAEKTAGKSDAPRSAQAPTLPASLSKRGACVVTMRGGGEGDNTLTLDAATLETQDGRTHDSPGTVAAGMTVGINAAAMGTAYLYEDGSRAAPYAALSMTVFGVMTVVFTSIQPLAGWVVSCVA